jgi:hypothetical protein
MDILHHDGSTVFSLRLDLNCIRDNTTKGFDTTTNGVTEVRNVVLPLH